MSNSRQSYRWVGAGIFMLLAMVTIFALSNAFAYFKSGASKTDIYHAAEAYFDSTRPYIRWIADDDNIEGDINKYIKEDIAKAYSQAIRTRNLSIKLGEEVALKEHFSKQLRDKIASNFWDEHFESFEQVNLSHSLQLHFISLDKSVVSFTDVNSRIKQKIGSSYIDATHAYHINMTLVDGRWRIDALEQTSPIEEITKSDNSKFTRDITGKRGVNYYPAKTPWKLFWSAYDEKIIESDFDKMKGLKFRMVRFFIPFESFGAANPSERMLQKMDHFIQTAKENKIYVIPTLFDFPVGYDLDKYPIYDRHLEKVMTRYANEKSILMWDLKNEPDLDFVHQGKAKTLEWLKFVIERSRKYTSRPITIGWSKIDFATFLNEELDLISFHYYDELNTLEEKLMALDKVSSKPMLISEYGLSTYSGIWPGGNSLEAKNKYMDQFHRIIDKHNVGGIVWCLYDYEEAPRNVFGWKPWISAKQKDFGVLDVDGNNKRHSSQK